MTQTLDRQPSGAAHMAARAAERLLQIDQALTEELARIDEVHNLIVENEGEHAKVVDIHSNQEAQRTTLQARVRAAQIVYDLAVGSAVESEKYAELVSCQEQLRLLETSIAHNYEVSQSYSADYQDATNRLNFDLKVAQSEVARLQEQREEILKIRTDTFQRQGEEVRDSILGEIEELMLKEQQVEKMLERAKAKRLAKQQSITQRLAPWPELALAVEMEHGSHESSLRTSLLERWYSMVLEVEQHANELQPDTLFLEKFCDMRMVPIPSISAYGKRVAFAHRNWSEKPGPIAMFVEYVSRLEALLNDWKSIDKKDAVARAMQTPLN